MISFLLSIVLLLTVQAAPPLSKLRVPPGFMVEVFVDGLPDARSLARGPEGILFVGNRSEHKVYLVDARKPGLPPQISVVADNLDTPNGVAYYQGALYIAENPRLIRIPRVLGKRGPVEVLYDKLPTRSAHGWRYLRIDPRTRKVFLSIGAPCNVCLEKDERFASIVSWPNAAQAAPWGEPQIFARGLRNSVGFDWARNGEGLWITDNGRDLLGDDVPDDELNFAPKAGLHFGFPFCHAGKWLDPLFGKGKSCASFDAPQALLGAHVASLGLRLYEGKQFPPAYRGHLFIAEHGSWNRSRKVGYRLVEVPIDGRGRAQAPRPFLEGFLENEQAWGRPVDVEIWDDGSLLFSDDEGGRVFRVSFSAPKKR